MELKHKVQNEVTIVSMTGSIDSLSAPQTMDYLNRLMMEGSTNLVADLSGVEYTSSAGLRVLLSAVKTARMSGGDLYLANIRPDVQKVLSLSGFTSILKIFPDVDAAVKSFA